MNKKKTKDIRQKTKIKTRRASCVLSIANKTRNTQYDIHNTIPLESNVCCLKSNCGFIFIELIVSFTVLGILITILTISLHGLAKFNLFQLVRQRCTAAAQAELDCIAITGQPISEENFERLWPKLKVTIEESNGTGQWEGLKLIDVKTSGMSFDTPVVVHLSRYLDLKSPIRIQEQ